MPLQSTIAVSGPEGSGETVCSHEKPFMRVCLADHHFPQEFGGCCRGCAFPSLLLDHSEEATKEAEMASFW